MNELDKIVVIKSKKHNFHEELDVKIGKLCNLHYQNGIAEERGDFNKAIKLADEIEMLANDITKEIYQLKEDKSHNKCRFTDLMAYHYNNIVEEITDDVDFIKEEFDGIDELDYRLEQLYNYDLSDYDKEIIVDYINDKCDEYNDIGLANFTLNDEFVIRLGVNEWIKDNFFRIRP